LNKNHALSFCELLLFEDTKRSKKKDRLDHRSSGKSSKKRKENGAVPGRFAYDADRADGADDLIDDAGVFNYVCEIPEGFMARAECR